MAEIVYADNYEEITGLKVPSEKAETKIVESPITDKASKAEVK